MITGGTPINRHWVLVLKDGRIVIDWGDDLYQDIRSGEFLLDPRRRITVIISSTRSWIGSSR